MKDGYVNVSIVKVIIVGPAGVGKTCLRYLLLSKSPPKERTSTGIAERPIQVIRIGGEKGKWEEISIETLKEMVAEAVPICKKWEKMKESQNSDKEPTEPTERVKRRDGQVKENEATGEEGLSKPREETKFDKAIQAVMGDLTKRIANHKPDPKKEKECRLEQQLICITDTGGQQPFWDLIPIFKRNTSVTLFVHRLCDQLDKLPYNDLYREGKCVGPSCQRATLTTAQAFEVMLQGLHPGESNSKIAVIGTHPDVEQTAETVDTKNKRFDEIVPPSFKNNMLYCGNKVIFEVNPVAQKPEDEEVANSIKSKVEQSPHHHKVPIWWYILEMILEELARELGRQVFSKQECEKVADKLGFQTHELEAALEFFDKLNIFFYKKDILPDVLFLSSQVPLDKVTELVEKRYYLKAEADIKDSNELVEGKWLKFRDRATVTLDHLAEFELHYKSSEGIFTEKSFLKLLQGVLIVAPISESEYFFPSLLNSISDDEVNSFLKVPREKVAPLVIQFPKGCAPPGVYCCMVCHLCSHASWEILERKKKSGSYELSRNMIMFEIKDRVGSVSCVNKFAYFTFCVNASGLEQEDLKKHCLAVKENIFCAVSAAYKNTHCDDIDLATAFLCPCQNDTTPHPATITKDKKYWKCTKDSDTYGVLTDAQKVWLNVNARGKPLLCTVMVSCRI